MSVILGVSASLRNGRFGVGSQKLIDEIERLADEAALKEYLRDQTRIRADDFIEAGRKEGRPFDQIYANLLKARGDRGLSNSEAALAAALWGARQEGADIAHCGLAAYFPMAGTRALDSLREQVLRADAIVISGPVYFGDRGSLAQEFIEFLREDPACAAHIRGRAYAGIAVGAKRNGGQETVLIYQLVDMTNLNMLAVGNDAATTSQYGGTAHAGDVGTLWKDDYGIGTSIGTGRRLAAVQRLLDAGAANGLNDRATIDVWLLQDTPDRRGHSYITDFCERIEQAEAGVRFRVFDFTLDHIYRCIACDICPTSKGDPADYRCIIKAEDDTFVRRHTELIETDAVLLAAYSPIDRGDIHSVYQRFVERTRYLRRDDYVLGDLLSAPFVISEINSNQNLHIRMLTSLVRHNQVLHHPLIAMEHEGRILNWPAVTAQGMSFAAMARRLTAGRLAAGEDIVKGRSYNPVGYDISAHKQTQDEASGLQRESQTRRSRQLVERRRRRVG